APPGLITSASPLPRGAKGAASAPYAAVAAFDLRNSALPRAIEVCRQLLASKSIDGCEAIPVAFPGPGWKTIDTVGSLVGEMQRIAVRERNRDVSPIQLT